MNALKSLAALVISAACICQTVWAETVGAVSNSPVDGLHVGLAKVDITPPLGYPMSGYYYGRGATGVLDPLHAKALVFRQGPAKAAIVVCDLIGIAADLCQMVRQRASEQAGIPAANIMLAATHCHTGPDYYNDLRQYVRRDEETDTHESRYSAKLVDGIVAAIVRAERNLKPARLQVGSGAEDQVSFNRRFVMQDGSIRTWANFRDPNVVRAAGPIDPALDMLLVRDAATDGARGALSVFALHLDTTGGTQFSADFPFHMERTLQSEYSEDFISVFGAGTCGDINHVNPRSKERNRPHEIGASLAHAFVEAAGALRDVRPQLRVSSRTVSVPLKSFTPADLTWATELISKDREGKDLPFLDEVKAYNIRLLNLLREGTGGNDGGQGWGTSVSVAGIGDTLPVEVQVIQVGEETAIVGLPGEVFVELGLAIKQASPYRHTLVLELANSDESGYIPTRLAYQGGGYEVLNSVFQPGGGEMLVDVAVQLLNDAKRRPAKVPSN